MFIYIIKQDFKKMILKVTRRDQRHVYVLHAFKEINRMIILLILFATVKEQIDIQKTINLLQPKCVVRFASVVVDHGSQENSSALRDIHCGTPV